MKWVCGSFIGALLFACSSGNSVAPETASTPPAEGCEARARARAFAERAAAATSEDAGVTREGVPYRDVRAVMATLWPRLHDCRGYDTKMDACVVMQARVSSAGSVVSSEPYVNDGVPEDVIYCLADVLRTARFAGGESDGTVFVPITFVPRRRWAR